VPSLPSVSGVFNPNLAPEVAICLLSTGTVGSNGGCTAPFTTFKTKVCPFNPFMPSSWLTCVQTYIQVIPQAQAYAVLWNTTASAPPAPSIIRITASVGSQLLGYADAQVVTSEDQAQAVDRNKFVPLVRGLPFLIDFRIEQGATCVGQTGCFELLVGPNPNTRLDVTTPPTNLVALSFPQDYLRQAVTLTISRVTQGCFTGSSPLLVAFGCYSISTSPIAVPPFTCAGSEATCARVEVCPTLLVADPSYHTLVLYKADPPAPAQPLQEVTARLITNCEPWAPALGLGIGRHGIVDLASGWHAVMNALRQLVIPAPAYGASAMAHLGLGGLTCCFSNFGWGLTTPAYVMTASVSPTTLNIGGLEGTATVTVVNRTEGSLNDVTVLGWVRQGSTRRVAGQSATFSCAGGSTCSPLGFNFVANNGDATTLLVCGSAEAEFELVQGATVRATYTTPITLSKLSGCP
jgi:hypothetical protein